MQSFPSDPEFVSALRATFGCDSPDASERLIGGRSAETLLKITVRDRHYVLRRVKGPPPLNDPRRQFACQAIAAEIGVTPPVLYADAESGVCITEFIQSTPAGPHLRSGRISLHDLAAIVRKLHGAPEFPRFFSVFTSIEGVLGGLKQQGSAPEFADEFLERMGEIRAALAPHIVEVPCHFDLNPSNILYDGTRLWLIDWEIASMGDPYQDIAGLGVFSPFLTENRERLLEAYLGRAPDERERAHLQLSRAAALIFYSLAWRMLALRRGVSPEILSMDPPSDLAGVLRRIEAKNTSALDEPSFPSVMMHEARRECSGDAYAKALAVLR